MAIHLSSTNGFLDLNQGLSDVLSSSELNDAVVACSEGRCLTGLDELLSKHAEITLPPRKRQCLENSVASTSVKPSMLFRPWESPSRNNHLVSNPIPLHNPFVNTSSNYLTSPVSTGASNFSETAQVYSNFITWAEPFKSSHQAVHTMNNTAPSLSAVVAFPMLLGKSDFGEYANNA